MAPKKLFMTWKPPRRQTMSKPAAFDILTAFNQSGWSNVMAGYVQLLSLMDNKTQCWVYAGTVRRFHVNHWQHLHDTCHWRSTSTSCLHVANPVWPQVAGIHENHFRCHKVSKWPSGGNVTCTRRFSSLISVIVTFCRPQRPGLSYDKMGMPLSATRADRPTGNLLDKCFTAVPEWQSYLVEELTLLSNPCHGTFPVRQ